MISKFGLFSGLISVSRMIHNLFALLLLLEHLLHDLLLLNQESTDDAAAHMNETKGGRNSICERMNQMVVTVAHELTEHGRTWHSGSHRMRGTRSSCSLQGERTELASALGSANKPESDNACFAKAATAESKRHVKERLRNVEVRRLKAQDSIEHTTLT